jgi:hypothetical protein
MARPWRGFGYGAALARLRLWRGFGPGTRLLYWTWLDESGLDWMARGFGLGVSVMF